MTDAVSPAQIPYFEDEGSRLKPELPIVERNAINAIIFDRAKNQALCLEWPKFGWKTFVIGGIEGSEDPVEAARREIREETGYKSIKLIGEVGRTRSGYYAAHKKENRISNTVGLLFELMNAEQDAVKESETVNHALKWIPRDEVAAFINISSQKYIWENALKMLGQ